MFHPASDEGQDNVKGLTDCSRERTAWGVGKGAGTMKRYREWGGMK